MNQIVINTGYMGSGSSAMTALLSEIAGYDINRGEYEYVLMHCPDGVFDLEDKLLTGNNAMRSDEAIHSFLTRAQDLHHKPNYWVSGCRRTIGPDFLQYCRELIADLHPTVMEDVFWYHQQDPRTLRQILLGYVRRFYEPLTKKKMSNTHTLLYKDMQVAYPTPEEFYTAAKTFLDKLFHTMGLPQHHLVLDQFLLPHNLWRINNYFGENLRIFAIDRDPRDVFLLNKYVWAKDNIPVPYPTDVHDFCKVYARMRASEKPAEDSRILRLHFEDMIYRYPETLERVYAFLGVDAHAHLPNKGQQFRPEVSINNTQLFMRDPYRTQEVQVIQEKLSPYLYDFPEQAAFSHSDGPIF